MAAADDNISMALFCDFENIALGVRDANYEKFDIKRVLERLLLKGSIVVKKAYCDWDRYKGFKATMHEANFELIEIPHVRQSGKNSADIRLVVDALDLCYTKSHVNTFVIISGDSDFSPLVSKLRENAKHVIGVGVKQSTSDLLIANCDEFIFYDDLVRESQRASRRENRESQPSRRSPEDEKRRREELEARRSKAIEIAVETFEALLSEQGDTGKIWASVLKEAIKRRKPDFSESYYGFRAFGNLLEEAQARGLLGFGRDEKSGAYVFRESSPQRDKAGSTASSPTETAATATTIEPVAVEAPSTPALAELPPATTATTDLPPSAPDSAATPVAEAERKPRSSRRASKKTDTPAAERPARSSRRSTKQAAAQTIEPTQPDPSQQRNLMLPLDDTLTTPVPPADAAGTEATASLKPARKTSRGRGRKNASKAGDPKTEASPTQDSAE